MADQDEQTQWLKANPAPSFAALIARHGGYDAIPSQAWTAFADAQLEWQGVPRGSGGGAAWP